MIWYFCVTIAIIWFIVIKPKYLVNYGGYGVAAAQRFVEPFARVQIPLATLPKIEFKFRYPLREIRTAGGF
jgi:hypothetical protein